MRSLLLLSVLLSILPSATVASAVETCDLTDCEGSLSLLGATQIGVPIVTAVSGTAPLVASISSPPFNTSSLSNTPTTPTSAFNDPISTSGYYSLPTVKGIDIGAFQSLPSSNAQLFNPMANQPAAPFNDPVKDSAYFSPPSSGATTATSAGGAGSVSNSGISAIP